MGWRYRKSTKIGPFRLNFSKSGIGWSVGFGHYRRTVTGPFGVSYVEETRGSGKTAKPTAAVNQSRPGVRWKIILGASLILSGLYGATTDPSAGFTACIVGAALLGWAAWSRKKIKNQNRPIVEAAQAEQPEEK